MIEIALICGIATALVFLINFYFPILKELAIEENVDKKKTIEYNIFYRITFVTFAIIWNIILFPFMMIVMFFQADEFKQLLKESARKRILASDNV